jgi:cell division protein FtsW (lipid II flippase)
MILLSSCGPYGHGQEDDAALYYRALPDDHTDFIYAVVAGQWGLVGCAGVLVMYLAVLVCGVEIASMTADPFGRLVAVGVLGLLLAQVFVNVAMTMGMMPITGMALPLVSYGGSSMLANAVALGLLVNVGQRRPVVLARKSFEYGQEAAGGEQLVDVLSGK